MTKALYVGSFDPLTLGHLDILNRAARFFDEIIVAIGTNTSKESLFSPEEKLAMITQVIETEGPDNARVILHTDGLSVDLATRKGAQVMIRGLRSVKDMEYEMNIASMNKTQNKDIETIFLMSAEKYRFISSSLIREIAQFEGDLSGMVPDVIASRMKDKYQMKN